MATSIRRNTFVVSDSNRRNSDMDSNLSGKDRQNIMRLRINRIALVQELKVDHILPYLIKTGVITEADERRIDAGTTHSDKARILIDLMTTKTDVPDWYIHFRDSLLQAEANKAQCKRYKSLVEFLDNSVIHRPNSQASRFSEKADAAKLPYYSTLPSIQKCSGKPQNILNLEEDKKKMRDEELDKRRKDMAPEREDKINPWNQENQDSLTLVKGYFQQWVATPDNFRSLIQVPEDHFHALQVSNLPEDKAQLALETKALEKMRKMELVAVLARRKQFPDGFELCMCDVVHDILFDTDNHHLYFKYLINLQQSGINLLQDIVDSYASLINSMDPQRVGELTQQAVALGFNLIDFMAEFGNFKEAEIIMSVLLIILNRTDKLETWMAKFNGFVKLMHFRNMNYDFQGVYKAYSMAAEIGHKIEMVSFGKHILYKGELNTEACQMQLERGAFSSAFQWARSALKEAKGDNPTHIINALCVAVMAYSSQWLVKKAERLAIQVVQQAKMLFGVRHPMYVKALLAFCHFSSEFKQDQAGLDIAKHTLETAQKVFGCNVIVVAMAHRAVCKAILVMQKFDDLNYSYHANEGLKIARICLHDNHPMLYLFLHTAASALQWTALHSSKEVQEANLKLAETEAKVALAIVSEHYGSLSVRSAQLLSLVGQIYAKMDRIQEAEEMLQKSAYFLKLTCSPKSNFLLLSLVTLGTFYKIFDKPKEAIHVFQHVIHHLDSTGVYLKWVHVCFEHLISCLHSLGKNTEADEVQIRLSQWLGANPVYNNIIDLEMLHEIPHSFTSFIEEFDTWEKLQPHNIFQKLKNHPPDNGKTALEK